MRFRSGMENPSAITVKLSRLFLNMYLYVFPYSHIEPIKIFITVLQLQNHVAEASATLKFPSLVIAVGYGNSKASHNICKQPEYAKYM